MRQKPLALVLWVIAAGTLLRVALGTILGLTVDETYGFVVGRSLSLSFFDHPPLSFWVPVLFTKLVGSDCRLLIRLPAIALFAGTTWMMYRLGARLYGERAGALAALVLNVSPVFSIGAGGWNMPDGPLMFFSLGMVLCLVEVFFSGGSQAELTWWLAAGALAGLALLSKYHAVFLPAGVFLFLLTSPAHRHWLRQPGPYLAALVAVALFSSVLIWNAQNGWVSFLYQSRRGSGAGWFRLDTMMLNIAGQALWILPWIWWPLIREMIRGLRRGPGDAKRWLLLCLGLGPVLVITLASLGGERGFPHWQAPGYLMIFPLLGATVAERIAAGSRGASRWLGASVGLFIFLVALIGSQAATGWLNPAALGLSPRTDVTLETVDWTELRPALAARGLPGPGNFVAAIRWVDAAKISYALGPETPVLCLNTEPHHFVYLWDQRRFLGRDGVLVINTAEAARKIGEYAEFFEQLEPAGTAVIRRAGRPALELAIYRARNLKKVYPTTCPAPPAAKEEGQTLSWDTESEPIVPATNRPSWFPVGYSIPPGKIVRSMEVPSNSFRFGDRVDIVLKIHDPATAIDVTCWVIEDVMVVAAWEEKTSYRERLIAVEMTPKQLGELWEIASPGVFWAIPHVAPPTAVIPIDEGDTVSGLHFATQTSSIPIIRGTEPISEVTTNMISAGEYHWRRRIDAVHVGMPHGDIETLLPPHTEPKMEDVTDRGYTLRYCRDEHWMVLLSYSANGSPRVNWRPVGCSTNRLACPPKLTKCDMRPE